MLEKGELLAQCAESKVYACNFYGFSAVLKHRFIKQYRHPELDQKIRDQRTMREARALARCRKFGVLTPTVYSVDRANCIIVMERIDGMSVRELIVASPDPTKLARSLLEKIGVVVGKLHQGDIIHGDLTTSNFLVHGTEGHIVAIDFGLVKESTNAEERAVDLYVLERAVASSHPLLNLNVEDIIAAGYLKGIDLAKGGATLQRLALVRARGRKRSMIG